VHGIPAVDQLAVLVALANAAPDDEHLASIAVTFFEPLVDLHWEEMQPELEAALDRSANLREVLRGSILHVPADVERRLYGDQYVDERAERAVAKKGAYEEYLRRSKRERWPTSPLAFVGVTIHSTPEGWRGEIELRAGTRLKTRFPDGFSLTEVQAQIESSVNESGLSATWSRLDDGSWRGEFSVASG
jgi:hypothetical protein